jgi:hypothetical protein
MSSATWNSQPDMCLMSLSNGYSFNKPEELEQSKKTRPVT